MEEEDDDDNDDSNAVHVRKDRENGPLPKLRNFPRNLEAAMFFTLVTKCLSF